MEVCFQTAKLPCCRYPQHSDRRCYSHGSDSYALATENASEEEDHHWSRPFVRSVCHRCRYHSCCSFSRRSPIFTINVPILRPVLSRAFWRSGPYDPNASGRGSGYSRGGRNLNSGPGRSYKGTKLDSEVDKSGRVNEYELSTRTPQSDSFDIESNHSTEKMVQTTSNHSQYDVEDGVRVETSYDIRTTRRDEETGSIAQGTWNSIGVPR
jgi:hypothetical protein